MGVSVVLLFVVILGSVQCNVNLLTNEDIMQGFMFPKIVTVNVGESVFLKLFTAIENQEKCLFRSPGGNDTEVNTRDAKILRTRSVENDFEDCGIKIEDVRHEDAGFWRLTSVKGDEMIRGATMLNVIENPKDIETITNSLNEYTPEGTTYCYVVREDQDLSKTLPNYEKCEIPLSDMDPKGEGVWNIIAGVQGQVEELNFKINIETKDEQLITNVHSTSDNAKILTCNLINSQNHVRFCRFFRLNDNMGLNLNEGIGANEYNYFGDGYARGQCGLEILNPTDSDNSIWKCYVGSTDAAGKDIKIFGALLNAGNKKAELSIFDVEHVAAINGSSLKLRCDSQTAIDYCWFKDPIGRMYSVSDDQKIMGDKDEYGYSGYGFNVGECGIEIKQIGMEADGDWTCHVGNTKLNNLEASKSIEVRVTDSHMISFKRELKAMRKDALVIDCVTVPRKMPLDYCRFVAPNGISFNLNSNVTSKSSILGKYFADPNHDLKSGHCSMVIKKLDVNDHGEWICAGKLSGYKTEYHDRIMVDVDGIGLSTASIVGMTLGITVVLVGVGVLALIKYRSRYRSFVDSRRTTASLGQGMGME